MSIIVLAAVYAFLAKSIYTSTASVRITNPQKNVLENGRQNSDNTYVDRYIVSEMGVIGNFATRKKIAQALIDSFEVSSYKNMLPLISERKGSSAHKPVEQIAGLLGGAYNDRTKSGNRCRFYFC